MMQRSLLLNSSMLKRLDMGDLEKKIVAVEVKAKKTSYLTNIGLSGKIHVNAKPDLQLSNLNRGLKENAPTLAQL